VLGFLAFAVNYAMRFNLSLAIVAMVRHTPHHAPSNATSNLTLVPQSCSELLKPFNASDPSASAGSGGESGEFDWTEAEQGFILGSFFWGYVLTQLPGGLLSQRYGGKWVVGLGLLLTAILTLFIPVAARSGKEYLIAVRIVQGLAEVSRDPDTPSPSLPCLFFLPGRDCACDASHPLQVAPAGRAEQTRNGRLLR
jgi:MFS family permease